MSVFNIDLNYWSYLFSNEEGEKILLLLFEDSDIPVMSLPLFTLGLIACSFLLVFLFLFLFFFNQHNMFSMC